MGKLSCRISKRGTGYVGTVTIPGLAPTKLVRSADGSQVYATRSGVTQSARAFADKLNLELNIEDGGSQTTKKKTPAEVY